MTSRGAQYYAYLRSEAWKAKRAQRLRLDRYRCVKCGSGENLNVHHRTYQRWGGSELMADLVTLCREHHQMLHKLLNDRPLVSLENMTRRFLGEPVKRSGYHPRFKTARRKRPPLWKKNP